MKKLLLYIFILLNGVHFAQADTTAINLTDSTINQTDTLNQDSIKAADTSNTKKTEIMMPPANPRSQGTEVWVFIACCITFFLAGLNRRINEKKHDQSILGFLNFGIISQSTDRSFYEFNIHQLLGLIVHNLIIAFWCFYFLKDTPYKFVENTLLFFILLFFLVSIIYLCKFFFQYLALNILQIDDLPVLLVKCNIGLGYFAFLISLPLFMVMYYVQYPEWHTVLVNILIVLMAVYLLFRTIKYFQLFAQFFRSNIFYNILYFCGLELVPLLVFIKISLDIFKIN